MTHHMKGKRVYKNMIMHHKKERNGGGGEGKKSYRKASCDLPTAPQAHLHWVRRVNLNVCIMAWVHLKRGEIIIHYISFRCC